MAMTTLTTISGFSQPLSLEATDDNMRDVSFSSYLNNAEETFVRKLAESSRDVSRKLSVQTDLERKKDEDSEIGVFSAEKYFKGGLDETNKNAGYTVARKFRQNQKHEQNDVLVVPVKTRSLHSGTPSVRSESSWNSQSALLQRNPSRRRTNKIHGKNFLSGLGCKCYCSDKDSVDVNEQVDVGEISFNKTSHVGGVAQGHAMATELTRTSGLLDIENKVYARSWSNRENHCRDLDKFGIGLKDKSCFTFPTLNSTAGNVPTKILIKEPEEVQKSLDVFGAPVSDRRNNSERLDKRLTTMMSWNATPTKEEMHFPVISDRIQDDNDSDASSDLFEIEGLTGKVAPFLARQESDANSGCVTPTTCYAPSEASVEWSVVTGSAADISVMSDYEEIRPTSIPSPVKKLHATNQTKTGKDASKRRPGILGCRSDKAVNVAGEAYKTTEKAKSDSRMRRVSDSYMPVTRFHNEAMVTGFNSIPASHTLATGSLPRPYTPRTSHLLYIQ